MTIPRYAAELSERLTAMSDKPPTHVDVVELVPPTRDQVRQRVEQTLRTTAEAAGLDLAGMKTAETDARIVTRLTDGSRAVGFTASGAVAVKVNMEPFAHLFDADSGGDRLTDLARIGADEQGFSTLVPGDDELRFERLWRVKAAGADREGRHNDPVLCRAVGAFRHVTRGLPVYGRASATVELAAGGRLASLSTSLRRRAEDGSGKTIATVPVRPAGDAAQDVATRMVTAFGNPAELRGARVEPEFFRFGYLSLGRRRPQSLLAPVYIASLAVIGEHETSAHLIVASASVEAFLRIRGGWGVHEHGPLSSARGAGAATTARLTCDTRPLLASVFHGGDDTPGLNSDKMGRGAPDDDRPRSFRDGQAFVVERMTGIEPAYSAWEPGCHSPVEGLTWAPTRPLCAVGDRC